MAIIKNKDEETAQAHVDEIDLSTVEINILHMYPQEMNIYGDIGNITALKKRVQWRGLKANVFNLHLDGKITDELGNPSVVGAGSSRPGEETSPLHRFDIFFMGGGQDLDQADVYKDLLKYKEEIKNLVEQNKIFLLICGGYQLFGKNFLTVGGKSIEGLGILDIDTIGGQTRAIGNIVINSTLPDLKNINLVGFENHSGRTRLLSNQVKTFGDVVHGTGNDEKGGKEGGYYQNVYGCYIHGSFLPKNPEFADLLISKALDNKYGKNKVRLADLDNYIEKYAREKIISRFSK